MGGDGEEHCQGVPARWLDGHPSGISLDGKQHSCPDHLGPLLPKTKPYDLALRCDTDGNVPQIQFNKDGVWHDFAPAVQGWLGGSTRVALKAGQWFSYLRLSENDRLADHRVPYGGE